MLVSLVQIEKWMKNSNNVLRLNFVLDSKKELPFINCYRWRKLVLPIRSSDETSVVGMAQSGRSEAAESASAKIKGENHAHCLFRRKRVNSPRIRASKSKCQCCLLRWSPKTPPAPNSTRKARVQSAWIVDSVGWQCASAFGECCNAFSRQLSNPTGLPPTKLAWFGSGRLFFIPEAEVEREMTFFWGCFSHSSVLHKAPQSHHFKGVPEELPIVVRPRK